MNILVISIDHFIERERRSQIPERAARQNQLEALIREEIAKRGIEFIGEESDPRILTIARHVANSIVPPIPCENIDMTVEERTVAGIREALENRPVESRPYGLGHIEIERRIPEDHTREKVFVEKTLRSAGRAQSILVLCGDMHTEELATKFRERGFSVETNDSMCPDKRWLPELK